MLNTAFILAEKQRQYQEQQLQKQNFLNSQNEAFGMKTNFAFEQVKQQEEQMMKNMLGKKRSSPEPIPEQLQQSILEQGGPELNQYLGNLYEAKRMRQLS